MDTSKPGPLLMLGGGVVMLISTFLSWRFDNGALSTDSYGLLGIITLVIAIAIIAVSAIEAFGANVSLPASIVGFSIDQLAVVLAFGVFISTFGSVSGRFVDGGIHLAWLGAALVLVGGVLATRGEGAAEATRSI